MGDDGNDAGPGGPKLASEDRELLRAAATGEGLVELTPERLQDIFGNLDSRCADIAERYPKLAQDCPYETRLAVTASVFDALVKHATEGGSFRYLIYDRLGFKPDAYVPLYLAGGMVISNEFDMTGEKAAVSEIAKQLRGAAPGDVAQPLDRFADPAEVRQLLVGVGAAGVIAITVDCALANPRTLPAVTALVRGDFIEFHERAAVTADVYRLTEKGRTLCDAAGIPHVSASQDKTDDSASDAQAASDESLVRVDPNALHALHQKFIGIVNEPLAPPTHQATANVLNALAVTAADIIAATAPDHDQALTFFRGLFQAQLEHTLRKLQQ